jgi:hypothetical protein
MPLGTLLSSCSMTLDGLSWVWSGLVANRSRVIGRLYLLHGRAATFDTSPVLFAMSLCDFLWAQ